MARQTVKPKAIDAMDPDKNDGIKRVICAAITFAVIWGLLLSTPFFK